MMNKNKIDYLASLDNFKTYHVFFAGKNKNQINYFKNFKKNNPSKTDMYIIPQIRGNNNRNKNEIHLKSLYSLFLLFFKLPKDSKVFIHDYSRVLFSFLLFIYRNKIEFSWVIWGWDLYSLSNKNIKNSIRKYAIKYFSKLYGFKQDFRYFRNHFTMDLEFKEFIYAPPTLESNLKENYDSSKIKKNSILVGHSASLDNNHIECFNYIHNYIDKSFSVYCILSYGGNPKYIDSVIKKGYELFANKFIPITDFMPPAEFKSFLLNIKFAILFNKRQAAIGFIYTCLLKGIQIAMFKSSTPFEYLTSKGIILHDIEAIDKIDFFNCKNELLLNNSSLIQNVYSKKNMNTSYNNLQI